MQNGAMDPGKPSPGAPKLVPPAPATSVGIVSGCVLCVVSAACLLAMGLAAAKMSESKSMSLSYLFVPVIPVGFVALISAFFVRRQKSAVAVGVPLGCGCLTWLGGLAGLWVFYALIWPSL